MELVSANVSVFVAALAVIMAAGVYFKTRRATPAFGVMLMGTVVALLLSPVLIFRVSTGFRDVVTKVVDPALISPTPTPTPSSTPTPTPSPSPTAQAEPSSPPPWDWIGFIAVAILVAVVMTIILIVAIRRARAAHAARVRRLETRAKYSAYWDSLVAREKTLGERLLSYEDDLVLALKLPVMRNLAEPTTRAAVQAMSNAEGYRTTHAPDPDQNPIDSAYGKAVAEFENALDVAETYARKIGQEHYDDAERRKAQRAMDLLKIALNSNGYPEERRNAYKRVLGIMEELAIPVTPRALGQIEAAMGGRLELTRTPHAEAEHVLASEVLAQRAKAAAEVEAAEAAKVEEERDRISRARSYVTKRVRVRAGR